MNPRRCNKNQCNNNNKYMMNNNPTITMKNTLITNTNKK